MQRNIFVTSELSPFTAGGIGRVVHNCLAVMSQPERDVTSVIVLNRVIDKDEFASRFPGVELILLDTTQEQNGDNSVDGRRWPKMSAYRDLPWVWESIAVLRCIQARRHLWDVSYIEFPDWGAYAFATLQERLFSGFLSNACIAIRLHTSHSVLCIEEGYNMSRADMLLSDLERKCVRDCDVLISQNISATDRMREIFGLSRAEWDKKTIFHAPPVLLDNTTSVSESCLPASHTDVVFGSKLQKIKDPKTFIDGCCNFIRDCPAFIGRIVFAAHSFDKEYERQLLDRIPTNLKSRFVFVSAPQERDRIIAGSIFVMCSPFESFCLSVYEASLSGAVVVLNERNPAFNESSPWVGGVNCLKYNGSAISLAQTLERALNLAGPLAVVKQLPCQAPWVEPDCTKKTVTSESKAIKPSPMLSIVIPHYNMGDLLLKTLERCLEVAFADKEIVIVDDGSDDDRSREIIDALERANLSNLKLVKVSSNVGLSAARNIGVLNARGEYILTLDADDLISIDFPKNAINCLERNPEHMFVVPNAEYFTDEIDLDEKERKYHIFIGEAAVSGRLENRFSTSCSLFRKEILVQNPYNEQISCLEDWALYLKLVSGNVRCVVTNDVHFFYRDRPNSMVKQSHNPVAYANMVKDVLRVGLGQSDREASQAIVLGEALGTIANMRLTEQTLANRTYFLEGYIKHYGGIIDKLLRSTERVYKFLGRNDFVVRNRIKRLGLFDRDWYLLNNPDLRSAQIDPFEHYCKCGMREGRAPNPSFIPEIYFAKNPDVSNSGMSAVEHYVLHGLHEGRII